jgi:3-phenylpropionate/trans-cinnamate dioxygenase ferredoxin subunit
VDLTEHRVAIFLVDGQLFAIGDRCSHAEASLSEGEVFDTEVECPKHGSVFDLSTGEPRSLPATTPVPIYQVSIEGGDVYLEVDE